MPTQIPINRTIFKHPIDRYPRLDTVLMIEEVLRDAGGDFSVREIWKRLPKQVMWQTYLTVLDYLEYSNKILIDPRDNHPIWIWDPEGVAEAKRKGVIVH
ncbi:MAG: hypothetical protein Q8P05_02375 [Candidatus Diapherotrites archaeon]|nr:hypothetical protein [Candidatus Diapherotrites archaeon]